VSLIRADYFIATVLALLLPPVSAQTIKLYTEDYPPFNIVSPDKLTISGIATDKLRELMRRAGDSYQLSAVPWARSMLLVQNQAGSCMFSTARTPEREAHYQWVGPLEHNNLAVFGRADNRHAARNVAELKSQMIGTKRRDASGEYFTALGYSIDPVAADADNPRKMMRGRFDYWATGELLGQQIIRQQGLSASIVPLFVFLQVEMYLSCNLAMDPATIARWNQILKQMDNDGTSAAIEKKYPSYHAAKLAVAQGR